MILWPGYSFRSWLRYWIPCCLKEIQSHFYSLHLPGTLPDWVPLSVQRIWALVQFGYLLGCLVLRVAWSWFWRRPGCRNGLWQGAAWYYALQNFVAAGLGTPFFPWKYLPGYPGQVYYFGWQERHFFGCFHLV